MAAATQVGRPLLTPHGIDLEYLAVELDVSARSGVGYRRPATATQVYLHVNRDIGVNART